MVLVFFRYRKPVQAIEKDNFYLFFCSLLLVKHRPRYEQQAIITVSFV